jgi:cell wall-associated NlpC family hydrolase
MKKKLLLLVLSTALFVSGCGNINPQGIQPNTQDTTNRNGGQFGALQQPERTKLPQQADKKHQAQSLTIVSNEVELEEITAYETGGETYVPLIKVLSLLNYNVKEQDNFIQAGFTDVYIEVMKDSNHATIEGEAKTLSSPIISLDNQPYITTKALTEILGEKADIRAGEDRITINVEQEVEDYGFPENETLDDLPIDEDQPNDIPTVSSAKADRIIRTAASFRGVPYYFGAPSGNTNVFDCSSFTQYVYYKNGIKLPRVSRSQAKMGRYVRVKDLRQGDLLFFYWPGRFKSNKIVGHVGIYIGNGYMIHSAPNTPYTKDGVQISNLRTNDALKKIYLGAKRVG